MALNTSAFSTKKATPIKSETITPKKTTLNLGAFGEKKKTGIGTTPKPKPIETFKFPEALGGGSFNKSTEPNKALVTERGYAGIEAPGQYREHIFPVALGGTSEVDNIKVYGKDLGEQKTKFELEAIKKYKAGELTLNGARAQVLQKFRQITGQDASTDYKDYLNPVMKKVAGAFEFVNKVLSYPGKKFEETTNKNTEKKISTTSQEQKTKELTDYYAKLEKAGVYNDFYQSKNIKILDTEKLNTLYKTVILKQKDERTQVGKDLLQSALMTGGKLPGEIIGNINKGKAITKVAEELPTAPPTGEIAPIKKIGNIIEETKPILKEVAQVKQETKLNTKAFTKAPIVDKTSPVGFKTAAVETIDKLKNEELSNNEKLKYFLSDKRAIIKDYIDSPKGSKIIEETIAEKIAKDAIEPLAQSDKRIVDAIKNSSYFKKEKTVKDAMGEGWLMEKNGKLVVSEAEVVIYGGS